MSLFSKLFGGSKPEAKAEPVTYNGFRIYPEPTKTDGGYRVSARIEKDINGEVKTHALIRADTINSLEEATLTSVRKAKQVIDEQGDRIFH